MRTRFQKPLPTKDWIIIDVTKEDSPTYIGPGFLKQEAIKTLELAGAVRTGDKWVLDTATKKIYKIVKLVDSKFLPSRVIHFI